MFDDPVVHVVVNVPPCSRSIPKFLVHILVETLHGLVHGVVGLKLLVVGHDGQHLLFLRRKGAACVNFAIFERQIDDPDRNWSEATPVGRWIREARLTIFLICHSVVFDDELHKGRRPRIPNTTKKARRTHALGIVKPSLIQSRMHISHLNDVVESSIPFPEGWPRREVHKEHPLFLWRGGSAIRIVHQSLQIGILVNPSVIFNVGVLFRKEQVEFGSPVVAVDAREMEVVVRVLELAECGRISPNPPGVCISVFSSSLSSRTLSAYQSFKLSLISSKNLTVFSLICDDVQMPNMRPLNDPVKAGKLVSGRVISNGHFVTFQSLANMTVVLNEDGVMDEEESFDEIDSVGRRKGAVATGGFFKLLDSVKIDNRIESLS